MATCSPGKTLALWRVRGGAPTNIGDNAAPDRVYVIVEERTAYVLAVDQDGILARIHGGTDVGYIDSHGTFVKTGERDTVLRSYDGHRWTETFNPPQELFLEAGWACAHSPWKCVGADGVRMAAISAAA